MRFIHGVIWAVGLLSGMSSLRGQGGDSKRRPILIQPANVALSEGYDLTLSATPGGSTSQFQWSKDGVPLEGATFQTFRIHGVLAADAGTYTCTQTDPNREVSASAVVRVDAWDGSLAVWPNAVSSRNSDPWLVKFHDRIEKMKPRVLYLNFANGVEDYHPANHDNILHGPVTPEMLAQRVQTYIHTWEVSTTYQPASHPNATPFISPEVRLVDLHDASGHANAMVMPRRVRADNGVLSFDYSALFDMGFVPLLGLRGPSGDPINLARAFEEGQVNEVVILMNGVDASPETPPNEVVHAYETDSVYPCYDEQFRPTGTVVNWPSPFQLPWNGVSKRVVLVNMGRDIAADGEGGYIYGYEQHAMGHELEYRTAYFNFVPYLSTYFRRYADLDMASKYGLPWGDLYEGGNQYTYEDPNNFGAMRTLVAPRATPAARVENYRPVAGNVHYPPGASKGYDYHPKATVLSSMETFQKPGSLAVPFNESKWAYLQADPLIVADNGGKWMAYWFQNMPGFRNESLDDAGKPMKNWWVFLFY